MVLVISFVVVLPHWSFSISRLLSVPRTLQTSFSGLWGSTSNLSSTLDTFGCLLLPGFSIPSFSHFYRKSFCFVSVYPKVFFTSHTFSPCWHICNSDDSKVKLSMKFLYAWYHRLFFFPFQLAHGFELLTLSLQEHCLVFYIRKPQRTKQKLICLICFHT